MRGTEDRDIHEGDRLLVTGEHPDWGGTLSGLRWTLPEGGITGTVRTAPSGPLVFDPDGVDLTTMQMTFTRVLDFTVLHRKERRQIGDRRQGDRRGGSHPCRY